MSLLTLSIPIYSDARSHPSKNKTKQPLETFSSIEPTQAETSPEAAHSPAAETVAQAAPTPSPTPEVSPERELTYEVVPHSQVGAFHKRLQMVDFILRKTNRAYDYRTTTVKQLELIVAQIKNRKD